MNLRIKKAKRTVRKNVTVRFSEEEYNNAEAKALVHTDGNIAEWIRYSAQNCTPRSSDLEKPSKKKRK